MLDQKKHKNNQYKFQTWICCYKIHPTPLYPNSHITLSTKQFKFSLRKMFILLNMIYLLK